MKHIKLPKRKAKRDTQRMLTVWVETKDLDVLLRHNINLSEFVRMSIDEAVKSIKNKSS